MISRKKICIEKHTSPFSLQCQRQTASYTQVVSNNQTLGFSVKSRKHFFLENHFDPFLQIYLYAYLFTDVNLQSPITCLSKKKLWIGKWRHFLKKKLRHGACRMLIFHVARWRIPVIIKQMGTYWRLNFFFSRNNIQTCHFFSSKDNRTK